MIGGMFSMVGWVAGWLVLLPGAVLLSVWLTRSKSPPLRVAAALLGLAVWAVVLHGRQILALCLASMIAVPSDMLTRDDRFCGHDVDLIYPLQLADQYDADVDLESGARIDPRIGTFVQSSVICGPDCAALLANEKVRRLFILNAPVSAWRVDGMPDGQLIALSAQFDQHCTREGLLRYVDGKMENPDGTKAWDDVCFKPVVSTPTPPVLGVWLQVSSQPLPVGLVRYDFALQLKEDASGAVLASPRMVQIRHASPLLEPNSFMGHRSIGRLTDGKSLLARYNANVCQGNL